MGLEAMAGHVWEVCGGVRDDELAIGKDQVQGKTWGTC